jgi:hypothetical protein
MSDDLGLESHVPKIGENVSEVCLGAMPHRMTHDGDTADVLRNPTAKPAELEDFLQVASQVMRVLRVRIFDLLGSFHPDESRDEHGRQ